LLSDKLFKFKDKESW